MDVRPEVPQTLFDKCEVLQRRVILPQVIKVIFPLRVFIDRLDELVKMFVSKFVKPVPPLYDLIV